MVKYKEKYKNRWRKQKKNKMMLTKMRWSNTINLVDYTKSQSTRKEISMENLNDLLWNDEENPDIPKPQGTEIEADFCMVCISCIVDGGDDGLGDGGWFLFNKGQCIAIP